MSHFHLFVYGTLRRGGSGADALAECERVARGTARGVMYDIDGRFPALMLYGDDLVAGEVWRCPAELLAELDAYEETATGLFRRVAVEVECSSGELLACWVYAAGPALARRLTPDVRLRPGTAWRPRPAALPG